MDSTEIPKSLSDISYDSVRRQMTQEHPELPSAAVTLDAFVEDPLTGLTNQFFDYSFTRQLRECDYVDTFLVTADSAIPVADAVRGYFKELGKPQPAITTVASNQDESAFFYDNLLSRRRSQPIKSELEEVDRLKHIIQDRPHIVIIDQFVHTNRTLHYASYLAKLAGALSITGMRGKWYEGAQKHELDTEALTSSHSRFMTTIGALAAKRARLHSLI